MLEQFVAVMPGTLAPALLVMSLSVMLTVGEGRDKPISSHWRLIGLIVGLIAAIVFAGLDPIRDELGLIDSSIDKAALTRVLGTINPTGGPDLFGLAVYGDPGDPDQIGRAHV